MKYKAVITAENCRDMYKHLTAYVKTNEVASHDIGEDLLIDLYVLGQNLENDIEVVMDVGVADVWDASDNV